MEKELQKYGEDNKDTRSADKNRLFLYTTNEQLTIEVF